MKVDTRDYPDPDSSNFHIPPGEYLCRIADITSIFRSNVLSTKNEGEERWNEGGETWKVEGEIIDANCAGRKWRDRWIFNSQNPYIQKRQVLIQHRVGGFPKEYEGEIAVEDFIGRQVYVTFEDNFYNGKTYHKVTFNGYRAAVEEVKEESDLPENSIPF